jgi:type II secretory pathway pseudopilin PulG
MKLIFKKRTKGFTLLEFGIVIGLFAVVIGLALYVVPSILANIRANAESNLLPSVEAKIQRAYANQPNYANVSMAQVTALHIFPDSMVSGSTITNRWGGAYTIAPTTIATTNDAVSITSAGVPTAECIQIEQGVETSFRIIKIGGTVVKADGQTLVGEDTVSAACASATNQMVFTFGK